MSSMMSLSELKRQLACGISRRSAEASSIKEFGHSTRRLARSQ